MMDAFTPAQVRERMQLSVSANGGHLASSLGAVELACALVEVFDPTFDRIVWDVGHQAYAWKILTDRAMRFRTLRQHGGLAPFLNPAESAADAFISGHAGVALAAAEGLAAGEALQERSGQVVAVVGDASLVNGESLEALRNLVDLNRKVTVVVNDNGPETADHCHLLGKGFFEAFGLPYLGPVDGHDVPVLVEALSVAKASAMSMVVHVLTKKGKGFPPAEADPVAWHSVPPFDLYAASLAAGDDGRHASPLAPTSGEQVSRTWSACFGAAMVEAARKDGRVCAVVAAMKEGTGLSAFAEAFPDRFFDVGICEEMAVTFAAGLAKAGMKPVVAIYSTFLQRAIDQIQHDVCLQRLPVVFAIDRAGCVGADGATHHGLFDIPLLRPLTGMRIVAPTCAVELTAFLDEALTADGPTAIRYPKGVAPREAKTEKDEGASVMLCAVGDQVEKAVKVGEMLAARGIGVEVLPVSRIKPSRVERPNAGCLLVTLENGAVIGGFGESIGADLAFGWPDDIVGHGTVAELEREFGFDAESVAEAIYRRVGK